MLRITLRNLRAHTRRYVSTVLAVVIGIAFLFGVLVQVSTFQKSFDDMLAIGNEGTDAVVRSSSSVDIGEGDTARNPVPADTVAKVAAVPGVRKAAGARTGSSMIVGADGETIGGGGPPQFGEQWIADEDLSPFRITDGRAPETVDEVAIDRASARQGELEVGDTTTVLVPERVEVTIVGLASYGSADSAGPVTTTLFSEAGAAKHLGKPGEVTSVAVAAEPGISQATLVDRIEKAVPDTLEVKTGAEVIEETQELSAMFASIFRTILLTFALIALVVAAFSIHNTFAIVVAQRTRDAALLRAIGSSRGQVIRATLGEALAVGTVGVILGLIGGLGVATGLGALMDALGFALPSAGLLIQPGALILAVLVGLGITLLAALMPAWKGSRVAPVAALRDAAVDGGEAGRGRMVLGMVLVAAGLVTTIQAALAPGADTGTRSAIGAALTLLAVVVIGPVVAAPIATAIGAPISRFRGVTGMMARRNAVRNPRRTASTATALVIGVAVVTLFTVVAASFDASITKTVEGQVAGDVLVQPSSFSGGGMDPALVTRIGELPEVGDAVVLSGAPMTIDGEQTLVSVTDVGSVERVLDLDVASGSTAAIGGAGIAVSTGYADDHGLRLGDKVPVTHLDGAKANLEVGALYRNTALADSLIVDREAVVAHVPELPAQITLVTAADGVSAEELDQAVGRAAKAWPGIQVLDRGEFAETVRRQIDQMLALVYMLLALSIGIALMGIANTVALSTLERLREIGLLRAVGQTRRQVRRMVRLEAVIVAAFGTFVGLAVGMFAAWGVIKGANSAGLESVAFPGGRLAIVVVVGAAAGVIASIRPARRAARTDVLGAIAAG